MWDKIETIKPPGYKQKNRGALYRLIAGVAEAIANDARYVLHSFFPLLADRENVARHGRSLLIPRLPTDTDDEYQERVASAAFFLERQGERSVIVEVLGKTVPGRYSVVEYPRDGFRLGFARLGSVALGGGDRLYIKIDALTDTEHSIIYGALDAMIDADIAITILVRQGV